MTHSFQVTHSIWQSVSPLSFDPLGVNTSADVCIIGAGITGLTNAYLLAKAGKSVVIIDKDPLGHGETALTSAHLSSVLDERYHEIITRQGLDRARLALESQIKAIDQIETIIQAEGIECDFERIEGYLTLAPPHDIRELETELRALKKIGLRGARILDQMPRSAGTWGPCLVLPRQAQFHPLKYLKGLTDAVTRLGGQIYTQTAAKEVHGGPHAHVMTDRDRKIGCEAIVVATHVPINDRFVIHTKQAAYRSYAIGVRVLRDTIAKRLIWDTADPYHYVRLHSDPQKNYDTLIVGGQDHRTGQEPHPTNTSPSPFHQLQKWVQEKFQIEAAVQDHWSGQIIEPHDGLAYIGRNPGDFDNVWIATGYSGNGLTYGTIAAMMFRDRFLGKANAWETLYDPRRKNWNHLTTFLGENLNTALQYKDWIYAGDLESSDSLSPGQGGLITKGLGKVAVYRDEHGVLHEYSPVCPHLGGIVRWNVTEKTFDCPCHGSRFNSSGEVVNGPSVHGLKPLGEAEIPVCPHGIHCSPSINGL